MAKLHYEYAPMSAGKSLKLLTNAYNYENKDRKAIFFVPKVDSRAGEGVIRSRVGLCRNAYVTSPENPNMMFEYTAFMRPDAVFIDEAQFLTKEEVITLTRIVDELDISVYCYGLKNDFKNELFEGASALLALADSIEEIRSICERCNRKATMNLRTVNGKAVKAGAQVQIGDEEYISVCRKCYGEAFSNE